VEFTVVLSIVWMLILGIAVFGLGVYRYQQVSLLAREGARWASVHGTQYAKTTGQSAATAADVYTNAISPRLVAIDPSHLSYSVTWNSSNRPYSITVTAQGYTTTVNTVTVTISYNWVPEAFGYPVTLTASSTMPMTF
jgi:Flp pilus assembly protein TadG